jgi:hypothetical protein
VQDTRLTAVPSVVVVPGDCKFERTGAPLHRYNYRIPCLPVCPVDTPPRDADAVIYTSSDAVELSSTTQEYAGTVAIPPGTKNVYLTFDVRENEGWGVSSDDAFYFRVGSYYLDPGFFKSTQQDVEDGKFDIGYYNSLKVISKSFSTTMNTFTITIPPKYYSQYDRLVWGVKMMTTDPKSITVSNIEVVAGCEVACTDSVLASGHFGDGLSGWTDGVRSTHNDIHILGRLGVDEGGSVMKDVPVTNAEFVEVELGLMATNPNALSVSFSFNVRIHNLFAFHDFVWSTLMFVFFNFSD